MVGRLVIMLALVSAPAAAEPITWIAPDGCPDGAALEARVEELADAPAATWPPDFAVKGEVSQGAERWQLVIASGDASPRTIDGESCAALLEAAALLVALDLGAVLEQPRAAPPPAEPEPVVVVREVAPAVAPRASQPWRISAAVAGDAGSLPGPALGGVARAGLGLGRFAAELAIAAWPARRGESAEGDVDVSMIWAAPGACMRVAAPLHACAGLQVGWLSARGRAVDEPLRTGAIWLAPEAGVALDVPVAGPVSAELRAAAAAPLVRPRFQLGDGALAHQPSPVVAQIALGLAWRFP